MKIKEILTKDPEVISPDAMIYNAAAKMKEHDIGMLPVCDGQRLVGCITDRDLAIRAVAERADPRSTPVKQVMTSHLFYCFEDDDLESAAQLMEEKQVRRLPVLNREKRLVGIVSLGDFVYAPKTISLPKKSWNRLANRFDSRFGSFVYGKITGTRRTGA